ncbi:MAG: Cu(I)-responsive transcriptional regulator [Burkholderiaceae bacterium]
MSSLVNIGQAARASGVSAKMIRHYESVGLLPDALRTGSGYRQYAEKDLHTLRFIRHSRDLGFSIEQIHGLLELWLNRRRPSRQVKDLAQTHLDELEQKLRELQAMKSTLEHLVSCCHGDERPDCPILDTLADDSVASPVGMPAAGAVRTRGLKSGRAA